MVLLALFAVPFAAGQSGNPIDLVPVVYRQQADTILNDNSDADRARLVTAFAKGKRADRQEFLLRLQDSDQSRSPGVLPRRAAAVLLQS